MSYIRLPLQRELIEQKVQEYVADCGIVHKTKSKDNKIRYEIQFFDKTVKPAMLDIDFNMDGTTTMIALRGQNQDYSNKLASYVEVNTKVVLYDTDNLFFDSISDEDFNYLIDYVGENGITITQSPIPSGMKYVFSGRYGDTLTATRYNKGSIFFQGRPSITFNTTIAALGDIYPSDVILVGLQKYYKIGFDKNYLSNELQCRYAKLSAFLNEDLLNIILPTIALCRAIPDGLTDYSYLCFPLLRGLEGIIKMLFQQKSISIPLKSGFGGFLSYDDAAETASLLEPHLSAIGDVVFQTRVEQLYVLLNKQRHRIFHYDPLSPLRLERDDAMSIVDDTLTRIENAF